MNIIVRVVAENFSSPKFIARINANGDNIMIQGKIPPLSIKLWYKPVDAPYQETAAVVSRPTTIHEKTFETKFLDNEVELSDCKSTDLSKSLGGLE
tara:strand:- start:278 stop:565 length:288 start_codon:yes stop_codon:yes gene_type:complete